MESSQNESERTPAVPLDVEYSTEETATPPSLESQHPEIAQTQPDEFEDDLTSPFTIFGRSTPLSKELFNVIWLGFCFFLIIVPYLAAQV